LAKEHVVVWCTLRAWPTRCFKCMTQSTCFPQLCQIFTDLNNISGRLNDIMWLLTIPPHLTYAATVPCNVSLTTALVGDFRSFSDPNVSQGSVATHVKCGAIFSKYSAANLLTVKFLQSRSRNNWVSAVSLASRCCGNTVQSILMTLLLCHTHRHTRSAAWRSGYRGVRHMNEVNTRRARLVLGWVTIFGRVYHLGM